MLLFELNIHVGHLLIDHVFKSQEAGIKTNKQTPTNKLQSLKHYINK